MKKALALIMAAALAGTSLAGCGGKAEEKTTDTKPVENAAENGGAAQAEGTSEWPAIGTADSPVEVKVMIKDVFPDEEDVQLLREAINEKMAAHGQYVDLQFLEPPAGSYATAVPIAMMNGDVEADLIYFQGGDLALAQQGLFEDLTPYVEKSTFVKSIMTDVNKTRMANYPYLIWLAPSRIQIPAMRKDWAEQLDSYEKLIADPTVDNYYNLFKEMKDKGLVEYAFTADGSTARLDSIFNQAFGVTGTIVKEDGKWIFSKESQAEKDKLEFYAKLYKDGLLDPEYLTDTWDTMEQKFYEGKTGVIAGTLPSTQIYDNKMRSVNGEESELVILPPAKGVAQGYRAEDVTKEERGFAMNIDSENKDAAWAVLEFMASPEGRILDKVGIEGKHYTIEDNKIVFTDRWPEWWARFWDTTNNFDPQDPSLAQPVLTTVGQSAFDNLEKYLVQDVNILIPEEMTPQWDAMNGYYNEYSADIVRGVKSIDTFSEMKTKWEEAGGNEFESLLVEKLGNP
ncbi:extracellular solute-binding protein [[Clostridium] symbiosum]|uniref:extracellular solute-binding protein n=1 Tax=Clostridium symbiosum TaxID=1512 RepID=UPI001D099ACF|nr:extracellular solute-binding protein [[Clostridium] symbiosum]MCB6609023.1 extracellular solute-binding protein [[Clostridium] symbiosum]MCB6930448.1 extracellular solute-binding protein [[Clostridium] symbiosum]